VAAAAKIAVTGVAIAAAIGTNASNKTYYRTR
jgi:hypothetical protein